MTTRRRFVRRAGSGAWLAGAATALAAPAAHAAGQLKLIPDDWNVVIVLVVGFALLIPVVNALIVQPVLKVVDEREDKIAGARRRAEKLERDADAVLARYEEEVRETREACDRDRRAHLDAARAQQTEIASEARSEAEREIAQSRRELDASLADARASLRGAAEQLARQAAERILGRTVA